MKIFQILFVVLTCIASILTGCMEDNFSTNPNDRLSFSSDTIRFDTLFTTIGSSTARLMVYNAHSKTINIESISLRSSGSSGFRINVDGIKGTKFQNIEINKKDSLYIFIEVTVRTTSQDQPIRNEDWIEFEYNGIRQQILLEAYGQDVIIWRGKRIDQDTIITANKPLLVYDSLVIEPDVRLELLPGTRFFFHDKARVIVRGSIVANGTYENPILFRGDRTDNLFNDLPYDEVSGTWDGIHFESSSYNNLFVQTRIRGTSSGIRFDSSSVDPIKAKFEGSILKNSKGDLLVAENVRLEAVNCEFSNAGGALVRLLGGNYRFTHCTIVNLYPLGSVSSRAVHLSNYKNNQSGNATPLPLIQAEFNNTIIWGKHNIEVHLDWITTNSPDTTPSAHLFNHCLIKANGTDDDDFISTLWNENPLFKQIGNQSKYKFDFSLQETSPARGAGHSVFAIDHPFDLTGAYRSPGRVDLGCYQYVAID